MRETILLFHIEDKTRLNKIRKALLPLKLRIKVVQPEEYCQPVGFLAGDPEIFPVQETTGEKPEEITEEMMVMAWLSSGRVDQVIRAFRKAGLARIDYKAVITPQNRFWDCRKLYGELVREHAAYESGSAL